MSTASVSLRRYLSAPASALEPDFFGQEAAACFAPLLSPWCGFTPAKWQAVKAVRKALLENSCLKPFSVQLRWKRQTMAYMDDAGQIYLSVGLMAGSSAMSVLSVYCHELAHIKLSQQPDYPAIKELQREFKRQFKDHEHCELLSPIEFYAMLISLPLLAAIAEQAEDARQKKKLLHLKEDLERKIHLLEREIIKLSSSVNPAAKPQQ